MVAKIALDAISKSFRRHGTDAAVEADAHYRAPGFEALDRDIARAGSHIYFIEYAADAIASITLQGIVISWNPGAERLYGYSAEEALGRPLSIIMPADRAHELGEILDRLERSTPVSSFESQRVAKHGRRISYRLRVIATADRNDTARTFIDA